MARLPDDIAFRAKLRLLCDQHGWKLEVYARGAVCVVSRPEGKTGTRVTGGPAASVLQSIAGG